MRHADEPETIVDLGGGLRVPLSELVDADELCPNCTHSSDNHDECGCDVPGCDCEGP